jgi:predicted restriction endonuclease
MRNHTKVYLRAFNYHESDFIPCEVCYSKAVDIHHIEARGMGGNKDADSILNLMALCRKCHDLFGDRKQFITFLKQKHEERLNQITL